MIIYKLNIPSLNLSLCNITTHDSERVNIAVIDRDESAIGQYTMIKIKVFNRNLGNLTGNNAQFTVDNTIINGVISEIIIADNSTEIEIINKDLS